MPLPLERLAAFLLAISLSHSALADESPFHAGDKLTVVTTAGQCSGTFEEVTDSEFIKLREDGRELPTFIPLTSVGYIQLENVRSDQSRIARLPGGRGGLSFRSRRSGILDFAPNDEDDEEADRQQHFIYGVPQVTDTERFEFIPRGHALPVPGYAVYKREAFTIGHYEKFRVPAWVAMKWSREAFQNNRSFDRDDFSFEEDNELPRHARAPTSLDHATYGYERGHMARNQDLYAFGFDATREGFLMSNIVPQQRPGHSTWGHLENEHRTIVGARSDISELWVVSGPIFYGNEVRETIRSNSREIGAPHATYKVIAWFTGDSEFHCRGYIIDQEDDIDRPDLHLAIRAVDTIEEATGLDFFHELPDDVEDALESKVHARMWDDQPVERASGVTMVSLLPNPTGADAGHEFVKLENSTDRRINLTGWQLRNEDGQYFDLSRFYVRAHGSFEIYLRGGRFELGNNGDDVELLGPANETVDRFSYDGAEAVEGQVLVRP